jgi:hypothetical protein
VRGGCWRLLSVRAHGPLELITPIAITPDYFGFDARALSERQVRSLGLPGECRTAFDLRGSTGRLNKRAAGKRAYSQVHSALRTRHAYPISWAMTNRVWYFSSVLHRPGSDSVAHMWQWRIEMEGALIRRSSSFFYILDDCVRDAQENGFEGQLSDNSSYGHKGYRVESADDKGNAAPHD